MRYLLLLMPSFAFAQDASGDTSAAVSAIPEVGPDVITQLAEQGHLLYLAIAIGINVLIALFKAPWINQYFKSAKVKKYKVWIALVLGAASGGFVAHVTGQDISHTITAGIEAGLAAAGLREWTRSTPLIPSLMEIIKVSVKYKTKP